MSVYSPYCIYLMLWKFVEIPVMSILKNFSLEKSQVFNEAIYSAHLNIKKFREKCLSSYNFKHNWWNIFNGTNSSFAFLIAFYQNRLNILRKETHHVTKILRQIMSSVSLCHQSRLQLSHFTSMSTCFQAFTVTDFLRWITFI